jgi:hypothetical protein
MGRVRFARTSPVAWSASPRWPLPTRPDLYADAVPIALAVLGVSQPFYSAKGEGSGSMGER